MKGAPRCKAATRTSVQTLPSKKFKAGGADICLLVVYEPSKQAIVTGYPATTAKAEQGVRRWQPSLNL